ncbi:hypothetical protein NECAME_07050 [Necator americanus]|uniref:Uncharacterized protein n=1 Tax=Necator americanus TaxID=51031 RepID=W2TSS5_NECAM|nr:hypothetical protein NECAME_07050 [Necator americanus]ETN84102.1 hypothetical protein NECAME_07050 [Necator americanus]
MWDTVESFLEIEKSKMHTALFRRIAGALPGIIKDDDRNDNSNVSGLLFIFEEKSQEDPNILTL